ncbi:sensor histidine kinase [Paenibacillus cremeus]|uniref:Sensor histidine kinase n=1 Tax=Paenibacillus cremeus TaxID=2163881 RepID=A0A559K4E7_9BACL|nr:sensor histidine kinase [Paenibacillus cremeus]TVY07019.1 sensor histidine kinase [Paenibacillus cremeus]
MNHRPIASIRWKLAALCSIVTLLVFVLSTGTFLFVFDLSLRVIFLVEWLNFPVLLWIGVIVNLIGTSAGYIIGRNMKERLEELDDAVYKYGRGHFGHRLQIEVSSKLDEIGLTALHLNEMAEQIERQVASLQKLSTKNVELLEQSNRTVVLEERQRIARELHDAVSQQLFAIAMMTAAILESDELGEGKLRKRIAAVEKLAETAQNEMRALLMQLRPPTLADKSLKEAIEQFLHECVEKQHQLKLHWELEQLPELSKGIEDHLFRMVQEGMSNILRHSEATSASVRLRVVDGRMLHLRVSDNGIGFEVSVIKNSSFGLKTLQERANEIGGVVDIISAPGKGTQVDVKVPIVIKGEIEES